MSAADPAEQLMVIGHQLQAMQLRLAHLATELTLPPLLQQLLTDPLTRLTELLQPLAKWPLPQPNSDDPARGLAPSQTLLHASAPWVGSRVGRPQPAAAASSGGGESRWSSVRGEASQSFSSPLEPLERSPVGSSEAGKTPAVVPGQGARLTREASTLLSILQFNVAHPVEPLAVTAPEIVPPTWPGTGTATGPGHPTEARAPTARGVSSPARNRAEPPVYPAAQAVSMLTNGQEDANIATPLMQIVPSHEHTPEARHLVDRLHLPQADIDAEVSPQPVFSRSPQEGEGDSVWASGEVPLIQALSQRQTAATGMAWPVARMVVETMPSEDGAFPRELAGLSSGVRAAQLEQIMEALADRLELMLLRTYGTTGV